LAIYRDKPEKKTMVTGITGGIGSGKSSAAEFLANHFPVTLLNADSIVHELLEPGQAGWEAIRKLGPLFINPDQTINKPFLRKTLFEDSQLREKINASIHPLVKKEILSAIKTQLPEKKSTYYLVEVPLLFEANWQDMFDGIIVVFASEKKCIERIMSRDGVSAEEATVSLESQWSLTQKAELADHVVDNSGSWSDTELQLVHLGNLLWGGER
jgi:dephospho-CoA kinase